MDISILTTKLYVPKTNDNVIMRPKLLNQLNHGITDRRVTLISASAGFGKTTLLSQWLSRVDHTVAWVSLDSSDNDTQRFLSYMVASLTHHLPQLKPLLKDIMSFNQIPPIESIMTILINDIGAVEDKILLILDDYQLIENDRINHGIDFLIKHMPVNLHLIIATREDPSLSLSRVRAQGDLKELRANDLRFTPIEIADFFDLCNIHLSPDSLATITKKTEGWIVGLKLSSFTLSNSKDTQQAIAHINGTQRYILDYLVDEVLSIQHATIKDFLLRTSILRQMSGALCDYVLDDKELNCHELLGTLHKSNLFILSLDDNGQWYRYHHLFADILKHHLEQQGYMVISDLHARASQWYESIGNYSEAFYHATHVNNVNRALELLENTNNNYHYLDTSTLIIQWIDTLDDETMHSYPKLYVWKSSLMLRSGQTKGIDELLDRAQHYIEAADHPDYMGRIATARATLSLTRYDIDGIITQASIAIDILDEDNFSYRTSALWTLGYAYQTTGDHNKAMQCYKNAMNYADRMNDIFFKAIALVGVGNIYESLEHNEKAERAYLEALEIIEGRSLQFVSEAHRGLSRIYTHNKLLDKAYEHAKASITLAKQYDSTIDRYILCEIQLANVLIAMAHIDEAITLLEQLIYDAKAKSFDTKLPLIVEPLICAYMRKGQGGKARQLASAYGITSSIDLSHRDTLTPREIEILKLIAQGLSNKEIGTKLFVAIDTVKGHNRRIFEKLQASSRTEAVARARVLNIIG